MKKTILPLTASILLALGAGAVGSVFTVSSIPTWYASLVKPSWNPPNWIFGPVWTVLYIMMGIAAFLIWQKRKDPRAKNALIVYGIHLVLNTLWSILFFGFKLLPVAFGEIIVLWLSIVLMAVLFYPLRKSAAFLLIPYLAWVTFASVLNFTVWQLNL